MPRRKSYRKGSTAPSTFPDELAAAFAEGLIDRAESELNIDVPGAKEIRMLKVATGDTEGDKYGVDGMTPKFADLCDKVYLYLKLYAATGQVADPTPLCDVITAAKERGSTTPFALSSFGGGNMMSMLAKMMEKGEAIDRAEVEPLKDFFDNLAAEALPGVDEETVGALRTLVEGLLAKAQ